MKKSDENDTYKKIIEVCLQEVDRTMNIAYIEGTGSINPAIFNDIVEKQKQLVEEKLKKFII